MLKIIEVTISLLVLSNLRVKELNKDRIGRITSVPEKDFRQKTGRSNTYF